ncbi:MAG: metal-dependent transcriptional regulator [Ruminococcus sp.]|nr:metal-dependent transcriptional regulator [Ruminococcus sp.]
MKERTKRFDGKAPSRLIKNESKEDYLESIYLLLRHYDRPIRSFELSEHMNLSKPSVCRAVNALREQELVDMDDDFYITLTESGVAQAKRVYAKHCYFKAILMQAGVEEEIAENEACRIEHIVSDSSFFLLREKYPVSE